MACLKCGNKAEGTPVFRCGHCGTDYCGRCALSGHGFKDICPVCEDVPGEQIGKI